MLMSRLADVSPRKFRENVALKRLHNTFLLKYNNN